MAGVGRLTPGVTRRSLVRRTQTSLTRDGSPARTVASLTSWRPNNICALDRSHVQHHKHGGSLVSSGRIRSLSVSNLGLDACKSEAEGDSHDGNQWKNVALLASVVAGVSWSCTSVRAEERESDQAGTSDNEELSPGTPEEDVDKKERPGFRDRKIIDYENRIRSFSTPDKIFRYFASYKIGDDIYMTPQDFLRSLTPGIKQPEGRGLDQFLKYNPESAEKHEFDISLPDGSLFRRLSKRGLISFSDYIFLLTILSTTRRQFEIAFRMFDLNGDGDVDAEEFSQVQNILRAGTSWGGRHKEAPGHSSGRSAIIAHFFGEKGDGKLTIQQFLLFQEQLQSEILRLEFERKEPDEDGLITERQFADLLLTYADYTPRKKTQVLKRVKKIFKEESEGVSFPDYQKIFQVLVHIEDIDKALTFHHMAGSSISPDTLQHVAKVCAGVELSDHVVKVIFTIFDEDGDGALSKKEFISVMRNKLKRGLEKPKDTGVTNMLSAIIKCSKERLVQY